MKQDSQAVKILFTTRHPAPWAFMCQAKAILKSRSRLQNCYNMAPVANHHAR